MRERRAQTAPRVLGRDRELASAAEFLGGVPHASRALVLSGEAGIGKSTVWDHITTRARELEFEVLGCRPVESAARPSLSGLLELLDGLPTAVLDALPEPQRRAIEVALLRRDPGGAAPDQHVLAVATLSVIRTLAAHRPVLLAVDDAQWLDGQTAAVIGYLARRLDTEPVGLLIAARSGEGDPLPFHLGQALPAERLNRMHLGTLGVSAMRRLVRSRTGLELPQPTVRRLHSACGGNPFYALEIAGALVRGGVLPQPGEPLPIPAALGELVTQHIRALPADTQGALLHVAALARPTTAVVRAAIGARDGELSALTVAEESGVIEVRAGRIRFTHPLFAAAVSSSASAERRQLAHRTLAELVTDAEERARHLALGTEGPDEGVAACLEQAAVAAQRRGASAAAAQLWDLATSRTPEADGPALLRRRAAAGECLLAAGDAGGASAALSALVADLPPGNARARVMFTLAEVVYYEGRIARADELCGQALAEAEGDLPLKAALELRRSWFCPDDPVQQLRSSEAAVAILSREDVTPDPAMLACALAEVAMNRLCNGGPIARADLARAEDLLRRGAGRWADWAQTALADWARSLDPLDARERYAAQLRAAEETGDEPGIGRKLAHLAELDCLLGRPGDARVEAARATEIMEETGQRRWVAYGLYTVALVEAHQGHTAAARRAAGRGMHLARAAEDVTVEALHRQVLGFLALSGGELDTAEVEFRHADDLLARTGLAEPVRFRYHGDQIEVAATLGNLDVAGELLTRLQRRAAIAPRGWLAVASARAEAVLRLAERDTPGAADAAERALSACERLPVPIERARTLLVHGRIQRTAKQRLAARVSLAAAMELFDALGATLWSQQAATELRRCGQRAAPDQRLTQAEQEVAALVAGGLTNREVAKRSYISPKTVELHLSRIYRKLGVRNRTELATAGIGPLPGPVPAEPATLRASDATPQASPQ